MTIFSNFWYYVAQKILPYADVNMNGKKIYNAAIESPEYYKRSGLATYQSPESYLNNVIVKSDTVDLLALTGQSNVDWTDLDINIAGSGLVPTKANAVILEMAFMDTGAPSNSVVANIRKKGETTTSQQKALRHPAAGVYGHREVTVGLDNNGCIQYYIVASGTGTANLYLRLTGWIEPA